MRCFIAIEVPETVKKELILARKSLEHLDYRFVTEDFLHITLRFLGDISPEKVEEIQNTLALVTHSPFQATLTEINGFPSHEHARVLWAGIEKTPTVDELKKKIDMFVEGFVKNEDHAAFIPHITLGRSQHAPDLRSYNIILSPLRWQVTSFVLKQSVLTAQGTIHTTLKEYPLDKQTHV